METNWTKESLATVLSTDGAPTGNLWSYPRLKYDCSDAEAELDIARASCVHDVETKCSYHQVV